MARKALIVWGGWDGHQPREVGALFARVLKEEGFEVELSDTVAVFADAGKLRALDLIVPVWTAGVLTQEQQATVCAAVREAGVGVAGCHGGMCDAFRNSCEWQFMTGGQWVAHPGNDNVKYTVNIRVNDHAITQGIADFSVSSEQYYMHVDPALKVLATTHFPTAEGPHVPNGPVEMPVLWTKMYGKARIFYSSLGHTAEIVAAEPHLTIMRRGFTWAAEGKSAASAR
jgi:type 1 glutamine amidotransferase